MVYEGMLVFNREQEEARREREKREQEWQAELEESMKMSDPTGHGNVVVCGMGAGSARCGVWVVVWCRLYVVV